VGARCRRLDILFAQTTDVVFARNNILSLCPPQLAQSWYRSQRHNHSLVVTVLPRCSLILFLLFCSVHMLQLSRCAHISEEQVGIRKTVVCFVSRSSSAFVGRILVVQSSFESSKSSSESHAVAKHCSLQLFLSSIFVVFAHVHVVLSSWGVVLLKI
jgi:hypothetical protein